MAAHSERQRLARTVRRYWTSLALIATIVVFVAAIVAIMSSEGSMRNNNDLSSVEDLSSKGVAWVGDERLAHAGGDERRSTAQTRAPDSRAVRI